MAGRNPKSGSGGFDTPDKVNSNTLKRHPKMDLTRSDLLQLLSFREGELQASDVAIATLKAEKAKQLLLQAKYGRFGLGDPFMAMQRDSDNMKDNTFDESAIKSMYDNQLAQLENLIATQRKAQMKMREQSLTVEKKYQKACSELDDEKRKHAQDTAQGDDVTYMLEKERERLKQEVDFEKGNTKKMEKDLKKTLISLEEERANSAKHKQVALMLIKERKKLVEKMFVEKQKAEIAEKALSDERNKTMNMADGLVQESKKSLKMEATMERQLSEFDLEREQMRNKLQREENRTKDLTSQVEALKWQVETMQRQLAGKAPSKELPIHSVEIKSTVSSPPVRMGGDRTQAWQSSCSSNLTNMSSNVASGKHSSSVEREAGLSPRQSPGELAVRKRDNMRYASPQPVPIEHSGGSSIVQHSENSLETRVAPVGAVSDKSIGDLQKAGHKLNVNVGGQSVVSGGRVTVQTGNLTPTSGPVSPRRAISIGRGVPPPIPPNKPILPATTLSKPVSTTQKLTNLAVKDARSSGSTKPIHIPVSVVHTTSVSTTPSRAPKHEGSPSSLRKPAQLSGCQVTSDSRDVNTTPPTPDSFDFLGPEMADLQQLLVTMVTVPSDTPGVNNNNTTTSLSLSPSATPTSVASLDLANILSSSSLLGLHTPSIISSTQSLQDSSKPLSTQSQTSSNSSTKSSVSCTVTAEPQSSALKSTSKSEIKHTISNSSEPLSSSSTSISTHSTLPVRSLPVSTISINSVSSRSIPLSASSTRVSNALSKSTSSSEISAPVLRRSSQGLQQKVSTSTSLVPPIKSSTTVEIPTSPIHRYAVTGNIESLRKLIVDLEADVNLPMKDGTSPAHCAAENGQDECLRLLIERGCNVNGLRDDQLSPVHCAAAQGHIGCLTMLLLHRGNVQLADNSGWTPLHWAAYNGHLECCKALLMYGAARTALSNTNLTPCHMAVHSGSVDCLDLLLTFTTSQSECLDTVRREVTAVKDKDGWTLVHLAASLESSTCLSVILRHCDIDIYLCDNWGRSVLDVSSPHCQQLLMPYVNNERLQHVSVELCCTGSIYSQQQSFVIGQLRILPNMDWRSIDSALTSLVENYFSQIDRGLRTKKISRLDPDVGVENSDFTLGLTRESICGFSIGSFTWYKGGSYPDLTPQDLVCNNNVPSITVNLKGSEEEYDSLAFDLLLPLATINNYIRLLEQYKCVVFYGPEGTRKKQLVKRLARHISDKERSVRCESQFTQVYLHKDYSHTEFLRLLRSEGCLVPIGVETERSCILLLYHLEKVKLAQMLGGLLEHIDYRGSSHTFNVPGSDNIQETCYFPENFYLIATMDKPRSTGLDLGLQQRFRWVHFHISVEPVRNLLARHLLRRLIHTYGGEVPSVDNPVFKAVEWLVCVWQRLNDGVSKLGLPDVVFGPDIFLPCPIEAQDSQSVLDWLCRLWNETISPVVCTAVTKGTGKEGSDEQRHHKVANTALYVLMQRAIVPGCPLSGEEKDVYLSKFSGSNELDVSLRPGDKTSPATNSRSTGDKSSSTSSPGHRRSLHNGFQRHQTDHAKSRAKHRNSTGMDRSPYFSHTNPSVKRRSLSDTSLARTEVEIPIIHQQLDEPQTNYIQAKVPKLEIRSPVLGLSIPLPNTFTPTGRTSPLTAMTGQNSDSQNTHATIHKFGQNSRNHSIDHNSEPRSGHRRSTFSSHSRIPQPATTSKSGSNELDVSLRPGDKTSPATNSRSTGDKSSSTSSPGHRRSLHNGFQRHQTDHAKSRAKHRNSTGMDRSPYFSHTNPSVKRRSLSDTSLARTEVEIPIIHQQLDEPQTNYIQAKVPKLEIRSPVLGLSIPLPNTFTPTGRTSPLTAMTGQNSDSQNTHATIHKFGQNSRNHSIDHNSEPRSGHRRSTFSSHSRIPQPATTSKRSMSSENLTHNKASLNVPQSNVFRPTSPFSFSLTTPTSSLFSFKFFGDNENKVHDRNCSQTSSPCVINSASEDR